MTHLLRVSAADPDAVRRRGPRRMARALASLLAIGTTCAAAAPDPAADPARVAGGGAFALSRWTIDGGGGRSAGAPFAIHGTIGQPDADPLQPSAGGPFAVIGGLWPGQRRAPAGETVFGDGFE